MFFDMPLGNTGQIALEFVLLLVFILVFISAIVLPNANSAGGIAQELERTGQARMAAEKTANTANRLQDQSVQAKQSIVVFVPKDANMLCESGVDGKIGFEVSLQAGPATACEADNDRPPASDMRCTKKFSIRANQLECIPNGVLVQGKQSATIVIEKKNGKTTVSAQ